MSEQTSQGTWSDEKLPAAVAAATSWRGVMRELGLNPANGGMTRTIRRRAALLGLDASHFRGNRSWSDAVLRQAVTEGRTWEEVLRTLGLRTQTGGGRALVKAHALRLGLDVSHLGRPAPHIADPCALEPDLAHLRRAAESLAATWFILGYVPDPVSRHRGARTDPPTFVQQVHRRERSRAHGLTAAGSVIFRQSFVLSSSAIPSAHATMAPPRISPYPSPLVGLGPPRRRRCVNPVRGESYDEPGMLRALY